MMLKKVLSRSGRKILKAIKKISSPRLAKKLEQQQQQQSSPKREPMQAQPQQQQATWRLQTRLLDLDGLSVASCSLPSLDAKSLDTFVTYVADGLFQEEPCYLPYCCCHCDEREENQRNENLENEMMR